ncbi:hypothetical protein B6U74_04150 [Candidatus Bathyarchaeota archaeon ex4484_205]|nr:MAG: hypothetical protein B6U74_04150 [Candidatus Bathyarchaeota archaeon ex4484_205]
MERKVEIHKFGGGVLGHEGEGVKFIDSILDAGEGGKKIVVLSALEDVTDILREGEWFGVLAKYSELGRELIPDDEYYREFALRIKEFKWRLERGRKFITRSEILGLGELLSTYLVYFHRRAQKRNVGLIDLYNEFPIIVKEYKPFDSDPDLEEIRKRRRLIEEYLEKYDEVFMPGFLAYTKDERVVTLGRGGSDTTAILVGCVLKDYSQVYLWKETRGIRTADPKIVKENKLVKYLSLSEALNIALFGGEVLHYKGMRIAYEKDIRVVVPYIKNPNIYTIIDRKDREPEEWRSRVKYVGGTVEALQVPVPYEKLGKFIEVLLRENLGDFTHMVGPLLHPQLIILEGSKLLRNEMEKEVKSILERGRRVAVVNVVGDGLGPAKGVLERGAKAIAEHTSILGNVSSVRNGIQTEGAYMSFAVEPSFFEETVRVLHREFVEKDSSWSN